MAPAAPRRPVPPAEAPAPVASAATLPERVEEPVDARARGRRRPGRRLVLAAVALALAGALALGPRPRVDTGFVLAALPEDLAALERHLAAREARFADITPGAEQAILWRDAARPGRTPLAVVYLHGFSATRAEVAPLPEQVAARLGANLFYARLRGHGRPGAALGDARAGDWLADGAEALEVGRRLGDRVLVLATSTGATLATWLLAGPDRAIHARAVSAAVFISPNFAPRDARSRLLTLPWGAALAEVALGPERAWTPLNAEQERYWTTRYPLRAAVEMQALCDLVDGVDLAALETPLCVLYAKGDRVIDAAKVERRFAAVGARAKRLIDFAGAEDPHQHVLAGAIVSPGATPRVEATIAAFLAEVGLAGAPGPGGPPE